MATLKFDNYKFDDTLNRIVHEQQDFDYRDSLCGLLSQALPAEVALAVAEGFKTILQQFDACGVNPRKLETFSQFKDALKTIDEQTKKLEEVTNLQKQVAALQSEKKSLNAELEAAHNDVSKYKEAARDWKNKYESSVEQWKGIHQTLIAKHDALIAHPFHTFGLWLKSMSSDEDRG